MNAQEIVSELKAGKTVAILSDDAFEFMREVERHGISCEGIVMSFRSGQCFMVIEEYEDTRVHRCPAQACCRIEGHDGNHWCSVCDVRDLSGGKYDEHECYPLNTNNPYAKAQTRLRLSERELCSDLGYCPDCRELAHDGECFKR